MTRMGELMHFGQLFKACGNYYLAQIAYILHKFCKVFKNIIFSSKIIFWQLLLTFGDVLLVTLVVALTQMFFRTKVMSRDSSYGKVASDTRLEDLSSNRKSLVNFKEH